MSSQPHPSLYKIRTENLDFMRRYIEAVFLQTAREECAPVEIEPKKIVGSVTHQDCTPHKIWMEKEHTPGAYLRVQVGYWDHEGMSNERVQILTSKFQEKFEQLGFRCPDARGETGWPAEALHEFPDGYPNIAGVSLQGELNALVAHAKATDIGRRLINEHRAHGAG